jgi:hypothetical protein
MSMPRVTLRLPQNVITAFERADANRSKAMRAVLTDAVADGEVEGVPDDLRALAAVEGVVSGGELERRRGTFRRRCAEFYKDKFQSGYVTAADAEAMSESWRSEAAVYGDAYLAWVDAVVGWFTENWGPVSRPAWPQPGTFHARADPDAVDVRDRLVEVMREARDERGLDRETAVARLSKYHPDGRVESAAAVAFDGGES